MSQFLKTFLNSFTLLTLIFGMQALQPMLNDSTSVMSSSVNSKSNNYEVNNFFFTSNIYLRFIQAQQRFHTKPFLHFNHLSANPAKWSNTLKHVVGKLPTNCLSMFDHFVKLALKGLIVFSEAYLGP